VEKAGVKPCMMLYVRDVATFFICMYVLLILCIGRRVYTYGFL